MGEISSTDFSTRFSLITREPNTLQTCKLSQKISLAILRRLKYVVTRKNVKLKSENGEIGCFWAISRLFPDFSRFSRREWRDGAMPMPEAMGGA